MKNYLENYSRGRTPRFQDGGAMPPEGGAPAPQGGGAPDLEGMLMQYAETRDPQLAVAICDALLAQMGGGAPQQAAPAMSKGGRLSNMAPLFRKGGKFAR
jgi:hypothetical protein